MIFGKRHQEQLSDLILMRLGWVICKISANMIFAYVIRHHGLRVNSQEIRWIAILRIHMQTVVSLESPL